MQSHAFSHCVHYILHGTPLNAVLTPLEAPKHTRRSLCPASLQFWSDRPCTYVLRVDWFCRRVAHLRHSVAIHRVRWRGGSFFTQIREATHSLFVRPLNELVFQGVRGVLNVLCKNMWTKRRLASIARTPPARAWVRAGRSAYRSVTSKHSFLS